MDLELYLGIHDQFTKFEKDFALFRMVDGPGFCNGSIVIVLVHLGNSFNVK